MSDVKGVVGDVEQEYLVVYTFMVVYYSSNTPKHIRAHASLIETMCQCK